jgi:ATP-dependent RNA helicase RhlE
METRMLFSDLKLSPNILKAVKDEDYKKPTPVQAEAIAAILDGCDILAKAQTGTGKTAGFMLPTLQLLAKTPPAKQKRRIRTLILTPTRELASQVGESVKHTGNTFRLKARLFSAE